jgi:hypothetical protein
MMDKDGLRRDSLREGLKTKGRSRREAAARACGSGKRRPPAAAKRHPSFASD